MTPGTPVYVHGHRGGIGEVVRTKRNGKIVVRFQWDGKEHPCNPDHVSELERTLPPSEPLASPPSYERPEGMSVPKSPPYRSLSYLTWVRAQPCVVCGTTLGVEAHHQPREGHGSTGAKCSDKRTIPLCRFDHRRHHDSRPFARAWLEECIDLTLTRWAREVGT